MSMAGDPTPAPVVQVVCRRDDDESTAPLLQDAPQYGGCLHALCAGIDRKFVFATCIYFFCCHTIDSVILHVCCCVCCKKQIPLPDFLEPRNRTQKFYTSCTKMLANLWASVLLLFVARWVFLRPDAVRPVLGASIVNEFDLLHSPAANSTDPQLRFNFTTHLLLENSHQYYAIGYNHPAAALFYAGEKLGPVDDAFSPFKQEPRETRVVDQVVVGRVRNASGAVAETFSRDKVQGRFQMVMRIRVTLSYMYWPFKADFFTFYECPLTWPVPKDGQPGMSSSANCNRV